MMYKTNISLIFTLFCFFFINTAVFSQNQLSSHKISPHGQAKDLAPDNQKERITQILSTL